MKMETEIGLNNLLNLKLIKTDDVIKKELKHAAKVLTNSVQVTPVQTKVGGLDSSATSRRKRRKGWVQLR